MFSSERQRKAAFARMNGLNNRFSVSTGSGIADAVVNTLPDSYGDVGSTPNKLDDFVVGLYPAKTIKDKFDEVADESFKSSKKIVDLASAVDFRDSLKLLEVAENEARHGLSLSQMGARYNGRGVKV